ncbi:MAG: hypothetical protein ACPLRA_02750, partial [Candidatus Saccharicenans sp.]
SLTTSYDINYAIEKAYSEEFQKVVMGRRLGELLLRDGVIAQEQLAAALRKQKRTGETLGEILVAEGLVDEQRRLELKERREREELERKRLEEVLKKEEKEKEGKTGEEPR